MESGPCPPFIEVTGPAIDLVLTPTPMKAVADAVSAEHILAAQSVVDHLPGPSYDSIRFPECQSTHRPSDATIIAKIESAMAEPARDRHRAQHQMVAREPQADWLPRKVEEPLWNGCGAATVARSLASHSLRVGAPVRSVKGLWEPRAGGRTGPFLVTKEITDHRRSAESPQDVHRESPVPTCLGCSAAGQR